jgi:hypothetical protein
MPDLQTELKAKVIPALDSLSFDDDGEGATESKSEPGRKGFKPTNGVSKATFQFIRDNAGKYRRSELGYAMQTLGYKISSTTSLVTQMMQKGLIAKDSSEKLYPLVASYESPRKKPRRKKKAAPPVTTQAPIEVEPKLQPITIDINNLKLSEARALYDQLKKVFG